MGKYNHDQYIIFILSNDLKNWGHKYRLKNNKTYLECKIVTFPLTNIGNLANYIKDKYQITTNTFDFLGNNKFVITTEDYNLLYDLPTVKLEDKDVEEQVLQNIHVKSTQEIGNLYKKQSKALMDEEKGINPSQPFELQDEVYLEKLQSMVTMINEYSIKNAKKPGGR